MTGSTGGSCTQTRHKAPLQLPFIACTSSEHLWFNWDLVCLWSVCPTSTTNETIQYFVMNYSKQEYCCGGVNETPFQNSRSSHLPSGSSSFSAPNLSSDTLPSEPKSSTTCRFSEDLAIQNKYFLYSKH